MSLFTHCFYAVLCQTLQGTLIVWKKNKDVFKVHYNTEHYHNVYLCCWYEMMRHKNCERTTTNVRPWTSDGNENFPVENSYLSNDLNEHLVPLHQDKCKYQWSKEKKFNSYLGSSAHQLWLINLEENFSLLLLQSL